MRSIFFLAVLIAPSNLELAKDHVRHERFEEAVICLNKTTPKGHASEYYYLMAVSHFRLNHKKEAKKWSQLVQDDFERTAPERYKRLADLMLMELEHWKDDDVGDISRDMRIAEDRLRSHKADSGTKKVQDQVVAKLDKLIKKIQDDQNKAKQDAEAQAQEERDGKSDKAGKGDKPMDDSKLGGEKGAGKVDEKKLEKLGKNWGKLPEKERAKAMQELTRDMPPKHRELIEAYFRRLSATQDR